MADPARAKKIADRIKVIVAETLEFRVKDERLGFITITDVRVTGDLQNASVFYTVFGGEEERAETAAALESAKGKLRVTGRVVKVKVGCACSYSAKLTLKGRTIARKSGSLKKAGSTVAIRLTAKQARAVRKLGRGSKALRLVVTAKSGGASGTRSLTVAPR